MAAKAKSRVLVVEDHPIVRDGLVRLINDEPDLEVCGEAEDVKNALALVANSRPDVALVDVRLKESSGLDLIRDFNAAHPKLPVLVLSMHKESLYAERALRAGARGYIMKQEATDKVMLALRRVLSGGLYVSDALAAAMVHRMYGRTEERQPTLASLTDREFEVFSMIGQGLGPTRIAQKLGVSVKTIETHREHVKEKLHLKNGTELTRMAMRYAMGEDLNLGIPEDPDVTA
jgi:DNA-binding NarL/FixJ family response regulator